MKLKAMALGQGCQRGRISLGTQLRQLAEKFFNPRRGRSPGELQQPGASIAQAVPRLPRRIHRHPRQHGDGLAFECQPPLPFVDKKHLILRLMTVHRDGRARQQTLRPHAEGAAGPPRVDLNDKFARTRRPQLEDLPFRMRGRRRVG